MRTASGQKFEYSLLPWGRQYIGRLYSDFRPSTVEERQQNSHSFKNLIEASNTQLRTYSASRYPKSKDIVT
jgi:hypothetical protein